MIFPFAATPKILRSSLTLLMLRLQLLRDSNEAKTFHLAYGSSRSHHCNDSERLWQSERITEAICSKTFTVI